MSHCPGVLSSPWPVRLKEGEQKSRAREMELSPVFTKLTLLFSQSDQGRDRAC